MLGYVASGALVLMFAVMGIWFLVLILVVVWIWYLRRTYLESRAKSFRKHLAFRGYSDREIAATSDSMKRGRDYRLLSDFVARNPADPARCWECDFYGGPYGCTSAERRKPQRFPVLHRFMKKDEHGWLVLPYEDHCKFWRKHDELMPVKRVASMMTKDEAEKWALDMCHNGTYLARQAYLEQHDDNVGEIAKDYWNDEVFTYGLEYGILIAVAKIYGDLQDYDASSVKRKLRVCWTCSDFVHHEHRTRFGAWLCGRCQYLRHLASP